MQVRQYDTISTWVNVADIPEMPDCVREETPLTNPTMIYRMFQQLFNSFPQERFCILLLDTSRKITGFVQVSVGTLNSASVHPREVFAPAITQRACSIILMHNHPSGLVTPSAQDISITKRLAACGALVGIEVIDHIIFGRDSFYAFNVSNPDAIQVLDVTLSLVTS